MRVQILGTGCAKCKQLMANAERAIRETGVLAHLEKVEDLREIIRFNILMTPGLVIDGQVKAAGRVLSPEEIKRLLAAAGGN